MATTTNYSWDTPDDTDLVKDGAAAIRTLGSSIDTTTKNLNPQTTTGALAYRSATANVNTALAIGTTGQVLTVAGGVPSWATPTSGSMTSLATGSLTGSSVTISAIDQTYINLHLVIKGAYPATADQSLRLRFNGDTTSVYTQTKSRSSNGTAAVGTDTAWYFDDNAVGSDDVALGQLAVIDIYNYADTATRCVINGIIYYVSNTASTPTVLNLTGLFRVTDNIDSITIDVSSGNFGAGSYTLYGVK
jgi:hypothetical protein